MVSLTEVQASNCRITSVLPPGLVAVFVGATSGIGETSFKQFAKHACRPRIYFIGRSQQSADRITAECKALNPEGKYIFLKADTSLIHTVDEVCRDIKSKEKVINLLFLCTGTMLMHTGMFLYVPGYLCSCVLFVHASQWLCHGYGSLQCVFFFYLLLACLVI